MSLYLDPQQQLALLSLADLYEAMKKPELAVSAYSRLPADSPLKRGAEIQTAINLDCARAHRQAKKILERLIESKSDNRDALLAFGNIQRERSSIGMC